MLVQVSQSIIAILLGFLFSYQHGLVEPAYLQRADESRLHFVNRFADYHIIMLGIFSAMPLDVLILALKPRDLMLRRGL